MSIVPFAEAGFVIQIHALSAIAALVLGSVVLFRKKGTRFHKLMGKLWVLLMLTVVCSSFFIHTLKVWGNFSPIHLISVATLGSLGWGVYAARVGRIKTHEHTMKGVFWGGLVTTGALTLVPGRILSDVFIPENVFPFMSVTTSIWLAGLTLAVGFIYGFWRQNRG